jgi:hypothetical protein
MTDPADRFLEERLHSLAHGAPVPVVPPDQDLRRGRRRLLRVRVAMAGATTGTLAVVLGITGLTAGDPKATETPPASPVPSVLLPTAGGTPSPDGKSGEASGPGDPDNGAAVGRSADGGGRATDDGGGGVPGGTQVKHAPTEAATSAGGPQPGGAPWGEPTLTPSSSPTDSPTDAPTGDPSATPSTTPSVTPTATASATVSASPTDPATPTPTDPTTAPPTEPPPPTLDPRVRVDRVLAYYNAVLSEHLDPGRRHLQPYDRTVDPKETRRADGLFYALSSTYRWQGGHPQVDRAQSGLEITVASGWDQVDWSCGATYSDWDCHLVEPDTGDAEVATHDGIREVAVEHDDGQVVVVAAHGSGGTEAALVAAASDDRLILPGRAAQAPPTIDSAGFASTGRSALVTGGRTFDRTSLDRSPAVRGTWSAEDGSGGTLAWWATPAYSGEAFTCLPTYLSCTTVPVGVDGTTTIHLALLRTSAGGGWLVQYDGPSYSVRVSSSLRTFPRKPAYAFVTQEAWQPVR